MTQSQAQKIMRDSEGHLVIIKVFVHHEELTPLNIYAPNEDQQNT